MLRITNQGFFMFTVVVTIILLYLLAPILTPFLLGALLAYLTDPLVKKLERHHVPHIMSVLIAFLLLTVLIFALVVMLVPLIQKQIYVLIEITPRMFTWVQDSLPPWLKQSLDISTFKDAVTAALPQINLLFSAMLKSGYTIIEWCVNIVLTPVVFFYLLRDWDKILYQIKDLIPKKMRPTIIKLAKECNAVLGEFLRGQLLVMFALALIYGIGLSLVGIQLGLIIGVIGGLLSIVPYLGSIFVLSASMITAIVQFGTINSLLPVLIVYLIGQAMEGYVLSPYLIGNRIGLHPVAVIFSILAFGTLFGFFGVLLALPASAVMIVLFRFFRQKYKYAN